MDNVIAVSKVISVGKANFRLNFIEEKVVKMEAEMKKAIVVKVDIFINYLVMKIVNVFQENEKNAVEVVCKHFLNEVKVLFYREVEVVANENDNRKKVEDLLDGNFQENHLNTVLKIFKILKNFLVDKVAKVEIEAITVVVVDFNVNFIVQISIIF